MNTYPRLYVDYNTLLWRETQQILNDLDRITRRLECHHDRLHDLISENNLPESDLRARLAVSLETARTSANHAYAVLDRMQCYWPCPKFDAVTIPEK